MLEVGYSRMERLDNEAPLVRVRRLRPARTPRRPLCVGLLHAMPRSRRLGVSGGVRHPRGHARIGSVTATALRCAGLPEGAGVRRRRPGPHLAGRHPGPVRPTLLPLLSSPSGGACSGDAARAQHVRSSCRQC